MSEVKGVKMKKSKFKDVLLNSPRVLLGLVFFLSGLAGLLNLAPPPTDMPEKLMTFFQGINSTGYFIPFLKLTETVFGFLLVVRIAPALALVVLAPVTIHIFLVHFFLTPGIQNLILPIIMIVLHIFAAKNYWSKYLPLFSRS